MANPYPGPRPFRKDEYGIFAGRDHEISELTSLIVSHQAVLLYAQSGAGKSSIVNAGLSHSLSERGIRLLPVARVGIPVPIEVPLHEVTNVYTFSVVCDLLPEIAVSDPWRRKATLVDAFSRLPEALDDSGDRTLSVCAIDQFEELFSVYPARWPDREKFFLEISALLDARRDVRILFVLREDSLAAFSDLAALLPEGGRTRYRIERLRENEAISAIRKPLQSTRFSFAPDVAETVVRDLMNVTVASPGGGVVGVPVPGEFVEPVYLQVVCYTLFEHLPENTTSVTLETYREFGDPDNALEGFYKQALDAARASTGVDEGELRDWFERKLITPAGTRGLVFQDEQGTGDMSNDVVRVLEQRHVIRPEIRSGSRWYELTHDRFIRPIQRSNQAWKSARWSPSFDTRYTAEIQAAAGRAGVPEKNLRDFLDSLSDADGKRQPRPAERVPEDALAELIDAGLLSRETADGQVLYSHPQLIGPGWRIRAATRGAGAAGSTPPGLPPEFLTADSRVAQDVILDPTPTTRVQLTRDGGGMLDLSSDVEPGGAAILAIRHPSNALTFHLPVQSTSRGPRGPSRARFQVAIRHSTTRSLASEAVKAIVVKVAPLGGGKLVSLALPKLVEPFEKHSWKKHGLKEGWLRVTKDTLAAGVLAAGTPVSPARSLLFIHGPFSNAASTYRALAESNFFQRVKGAYDDRIFAFDHFSLSRTPEENARMLLEGLPEQTTTFDVVTHSRGGLVLRNLVERGKEFGDLSRRFKLGRAVLVASPNDGTPLATPKRWGDTIGWMANLLELFPDNPFTTGAAFVANGLVWLAHHAAGEIRGLHAMDEQGDPIAEIQSPPGPSADAYSALVANYQPTGEVLQRLLDVGIDQVFASANDLIVPSEGGWRIDRASTAFIPESRIGCFGPGGNLPPDSVTHVSFFSYAETADFLVNALLGRPQPLNRVDPRKSLPDRRLLRGAMTDTPVIPPRGKGAAPVAPAAVASRTQAPEEEPLRITVTNGDLTFEPEALLLGHYQSMQLTGTEKVMDGLIGGAMTRSLEMGVYPESVGSHQIFINTRPNLERGSFMPRPKAVIVVGLGEEGRLRSADLERTVRQAVISWAQRLAQNKRQGARFFELATTLIGSGGTGIGAGDAARLVAQGVYGANVLLQNDDGNNRRSPRVSRLHFIELYLDRATDAWRSLRMQAAATPGRYAIDDAVKAGTGALQRPPDSGYRGVDYDLVTVETKREEGGELVISYTLATRRARNEVRGQRTHSALLRDLVATASNDQNRDRQIGRTLFNLLMPVELEAYMAGSGEMQIELDPGTARVPWEFLDSTSDSDSGQEPWAIRVKLLRKLRAQRPRGQATDADADASVLVIGEPECPKEYPRLFGARSEAIAVHTCLTQHGALEPNLVTALISADASQPGSSARDVVNALFEKPWRIVHIAGHGLPGENGTPGGVVLSNGACLGPDEFRNMRTVPELVFVNCCHIGTGYPDQLLRYDRAAFASGVAAALIAIGVRCVIAAGWAVDDDAARMFAKTFYSSLLRANRFIDAVDEARKAAYDLSRHVNTWAAYQCYGDPDWVLRRNAPDASHASAPWVEDFSGVASATALELALERIVVQTKFQGADPATQLSSLRKLEEMFEGKWGRSGSVAELFGEAFVEAGDAETGMQWYEKAVAAPDGRASIKAAEQLANVRGRLGWEIVDKAMRHLDEMKQREKARGQTSEARAAARRARLDAERSLRFAVKRADGLIEQALALLAKFVAVELTMERASLIGAAYRRRALVDGAAGRRARIQRDLQLMKASYQDAQDIGERSGASDLYYPASIRLAADVALQAGKRQWRSPDRVTVRILRKSLQAKNASDPDFWSLVGGVELDQYEAIARKKLASARKKLEKAYEDLHSRVTATRMWAWVYDTACLVLPNYASRATGKERAAANELLAQLRRFAHPQEDY